MENERCQVTNLKLALPNIPQNQYMWLNQKWQCNLKNVSSLNAGSRVGREERTEKKNGEFEGELES